MTSATQADFLRIVQFIEASCPDEEVRRRMGIGIARKLAGFPRAVAQATRRLAA